MDCFRIFCISQLRALFAILLLLVVPLAFGADAYVSEQLELSTTQSLFSVIDFSLAFVLGMALPIILLSTQVKSISNRSLWYFLAITSTVFAFLYGSKLNLAAQEPVLLTLASITLTLGCLWQFTVEINQQDVTDHSIIGYFNVTQKAILVVNLVYLLQLWLLPEIASYIGWLIYSGVILLCSASLIIVRIRYVHSDVYRLVAQWLVTGSFVCTMFFWLHNEGDYIWVLSLFTSFYVALAVNGHWQLVNQFKQALITDKKEVTTSVQPATKEELFTFTHDPSTNLPTYQQAVVRFDNLTKEFPEKNYAVVVIKPINFEQVNQVLGHQNSDILLLQLAYCLQKAVAENSTLVNFDYSSRPSRLARLQSLHFLAVMDVSAPEFSENVMVEALCRELADAVPQAMSFKSFTLNFELAFGIAFTDKHGSSVTEVIAHAGDALLNAKASKEACYYYDHQDMLYTEQQLLKMERLKQDIEEDNLIWLAAPLIDNSSNQLKGFGLDVRWRYQGEELLPLAEFVNIAEHSGDLYRISKKMIKNAFKLLFELKKQNIFLPVSIPLSSKDILEPDLAEYVEQQIETYNISGKYLTIELTEPVMVVAVDRAKSMIDQLKTMEVGISIDDFTGSYESLRYIRKLSVDQVKISCKRLVSSEKDSAEKAIVNSLINLSRTMKLPFVATHVDDSDINKVYQKMGGSLIQGQVVSAGVQFDELERWILDWFKQHPDAEQRPQLLD